MEKKELLSDVHFKLSSELFKRLMSRRRKALPSHEFIRGYNEASRIITETIKKMRDEE